MDAKGIIHFLGSGYSPKSFANEHVGINPSDYIEITSYRHLPFYNMSALDIPANWNNNQYLNIPINDFERVVNYALEKGYSLAWDGDATEPLFNFEAGLLKLPEEMAIFSLSHTALFRLFTPIVMTQRDSLKLPL